ncbi:hypothetical protein H8R29_23930 [Priestia megaterium]|jgi:hypothetical protein|uniref:Uncharacterized protein n=2 Tax=Priestia megaterium TaxID=1404 RepID=A0A6M6DTH6_PRIMG|nr:MULTISPECIES: hypothetical protein [Priestia]MCJ7990789.1 hypothetical protein [Priestia sp. OVS21]AJI24069.1 hypothetical protein BG04_1517 [Priestia megaterium NBRC 15308 = ATCC 14581]KFN00118.1 hypothetical protein DJ91_2743 [Priestia megaterium]KGJ85797.1 hypothetical protein BMT_16215 [Priestia megaterium NBRC 15308 = ATCC 14581]KLV30419.1 hypothetical protein ABW04_19465 [Priestia megaterium]
MKKLCALAAFAFIGYICHYDIKYGTIPTATEAVQVSKAQPAETKAASSSSTYTKIKIKPGDTVLSIIEELTKKSIPVSMNQMITDFKKLNNGTAPEDIQIGKTYKFPIYK